MRCYLGVEFCLLGIVTFEAPSVNEKCNYISRYWSHLLATGLQCYFLLCMFLLYIYMLFFFVLEKPYSVLLFAQIILFQAILYLTYYQGCLVKLVFFKVTFCKMQLYNVFVFFTILVSQKTIKQGS